MQGFRPGAPMDPEAWPAESAAPRASEKARHDPCAERKRARDPHEHDDDGRNAARRALERASARGPRSASTCSGTMRSASQIAAGSSSNSSSSRAPG
jgi:hypothetical protein